jgi:type VI secretion system protein ImpC
MLVTADLGVEGTGVRRVSRDQLDGLMAEMAPELDLRVTDHLEPGSRTDLACRLRFTAPEAFAPAAVARAVPAMADLLTARTALAGRSPDADPQTLLAELPARFRAGDLAAMLLSGQSGGDAAGPADERLDNLLAKVDLAGQPAADPLAATVAEIDRRLSRQVAAVCSEPSFAAVESAWRGLRFLLAETDPAGPVIVEVLPATKEECLDAFFEHAFQEEYEGASETPLALVVLAYDFDRGAHDLDLLRDAARMGESLQTPFLGSMGIGYWGLKRAALLATMPDPVAKSRGPEYAKWNRLREDDRSLWLAFAVNRLLARPAYGEAPPEDDGFAWDAAAAGKADAPLWLEGVWALAAAASRAYADSGPRLPMAGVRFQDLACRPYGGKGEPFAYPLEVSLSDHRALDLSACGLAPLTAQRDRDEAGFSALPTYHRAKRYDQEAATRASYLAATLPYQIFASMAANALQRAAAAVDPGASQEAVQRTFLEGFANLLAAGGVEEMMPASRDGDADGAEGTEATEPPPPIVIEITDHREEPQLREVTVRLRPLFRIGGGEADLVMSTPVPR